jgi:sulfate adenylyltransferase subunit 2
MPLPDPHLQALEDEAIHIFREVTAEAERSVLLYSVGKDSSVLLHLARKAFYPEPIPFPLLHIDTGWKFREMIAFRDAIVSKLGLRLISFTNPKGLVQNLTPFDRDAGYYTDTMKTEALRIALDHGRFDAAFGGARRDEEASRAKERVISVRSSDHRWDPRNQRPELWSIYNSTVRSGDSVRAFPLSNWTELDVWRYIAAEGIEIVPLYFAAERQFVERNSMLIFADDPRLKPLPGEKVHRAPIRFRTLGCFPLTGGMRSNASTLEEIIKELETSVSSERQGRAIDHDTTGAMEKKKRDGYF